ncbi:hypothetical protein [Nonomuraea wenchangensis]|uniref:hypothetical protein n=1 Tax=Nonomuraea wenchangensis TaxID=568860 RepID=UPI00331CA232
MFEFVPPAPLAHDSAAPDIQEPAPPSAEPPVEPHAESRDEDRRRAPRRSWVEWLEDRAGMSGLGSAQLPSSATVRAYHKAGNYVPGEVGVLEWTARVHGVVAVAWCLVFTCVAWLGSGAYRQRLRTLWSSGVPAVWRTQLPPLDILSTPARLWVAWWSAVAWLGLKFWRFPIFLAYLAAAVLPIVF